MKKTKTEKLSGTFSESFNYSEFEEAAIERLQKGDSLLGENGILTELVKRLVNTALSGEIDGHIKEDKHEGRCNRRNGYTEKTIDTGMGPVSISPPRDRLGTFTPRLIGKWDRQLGSGVNHQILMMYAGGNSYGDIQKQLKELYGLDYSTGSLAEVVEQVYAEVTAWQQRPLLPFYVVLFLDGIYFTTREGGKSSRKVIYSIYGIDASGNRDVLGIYVREAEGAAEWGRVLEDLRNRGVEDVLFFCVDGLSGFSEAILSVFPQSFIQRCIVHMVRSSIKFIASKDRKMLCADLRMVYTAAGEAEASIALTGFGEKWNKKYPDIAKAWEKSWGDLTLFLEFGENIRRMIYTTNAVEGLHRQIRKATKNKGSWVNDKALVKQVYIALLYGRGAWAAKVQGWNMIGAELTVRFGERFTKHVYL